MLNAFLSQEGWTFDGARWRKDLLYHGDTYCICPGRPQRWDKVLNAFFKRNVFTSEQNIDWWSEHVIIRGNGVTRGAIYTVDPWLFERCIKKSPTLQTCRSSRTKHRFSCDGIT